MTTRRTLLLLLGAGALAAPLPTRTQPARNARIGFLGLGTPAVYAPRVDALRAGLRDFGYIEGSNIQIEYRWAQGDYSQLPKLVDELVGSKIEVLVTHATPGARAAGQALPQVPVVVTDVAGDPVAGGIIGSLARPGGNITGTTYFGSELTMKRLQFLKDATPRIRQLAWLINGGNPAVVPIRKSLLSSAAPMKVELVEFDVRQEGDYEAAFTAMTKAHVDALIVMEDPVFTSNIRKVADLAGAHRLPSAGFGDFAVAGGLIGYGVNFLELYRRAAYFVDRILRGAKPAEMPFEQPTKFELVINLRAAKALGLNVPQSMLVRADSVIR